MSNITISKKEYQNLIDKAFREDVFSTPPISDSEEVIKEFKKSDKYNDKFIKSLSRGLKRSSYFK